MKRRRFVSSLGTLGVLGGSCGCLGFLNHDDGTAIYSLTLANFDDASHPFRLELLDAGDETIYEKTMTVSGAPAGEFTREKLTDFPETPVSRVRLTVGDRTTTKDITGYDDRISVSGRVSSKNELGVAVFV